MLAGRLPKITLVTPNYNYGQFIAAAIESVLNQAYPALEYIVLDDHSTDGSADVIRRYESKLAHWDAGPNPGQYETITRGFQRATGEIFGWLNSDDMQMPWALQAVGDIFATFPDVQWISSLRQAHWDSDGYCVAISANRGFLSRSIPRRPLPASGRCRPGRSASDESRVHSAGVDVLEALALGKSRRLLVA
jgi:glycosyltransferase involved in cell wall biosynthesis